MDYCRYVCQSHIENAWITQSAITGEVGIQLGMDFTNSEVFTLPIGKSFLFFNNFGNFPITMILENMRPYNLNSGQSGIITFDLEAAIQTRILFFCPTRSCQGLAMMASCVG